MKRAACAALFSLPRRSAFLVQEALQPLGARGVPQLAQRLGLDLPYALARDVELLADLLQRVVGGHLDAEAHAQHLGLARRERVEHFFRHVAQAGEGRRVGGRERRLVLDEIAEVRVDARALRDRKSTRLNSSHRCISYAVFCLKKKTYRSKTQIAIAKIYND